MSNRPRLTQSAATANEPHECEIPFRPVLVCRGSQIRRLGCIMLLLGLRF